MVMGLTAQDITERLSIYLSGVAGCSVNVGNAQKLSGGAIQENWAVDADVSSGDWAGQHKLVMRCDAPSGVATSHTRAEEFALLKAAHEVGVEVPIPCFVCEETDVLGRRFFIMHRVSGIAAGHKLVRQEISKGLGRELGKNLARIHSIDPLQDGLAFLGQPPEYPALSAITTYFKYLDVLEQAHPAIEWGLNWLSDHAPEPVKPVLCHRDYRTGNYMVDAGKLTAVLDWEFAGWSDPTEDIAWFCAKCWRFGANEREGGGVTSREEFYQGYEEESGHTLDRDGIYYWEVMAHVRWAVIACQQAARHVSGEERSLELALTAHVVPELELEILRLTERTNA